MSATPEVLPNSFMDVVKRGDEMWKDGVLWTRAYCPNCGVAGPYFVKDDFATFSFWLCDARQNGCFEKHGVASSQGVMPDEVFWKEVEAAQLETYGRVLLPPEIEEVLKDGNSSLSKLARDRFIK